MDVGSFLTEAFSVVTTFGQISTHLKIIGILTLLISFFKVSSFNPLWHKLGWAKTFLAPFLAFVLSVVSAINGPFNFHVFMNAMMIGFGSVGFHEMLDAIKTIPGLGPKWMLIINFVSQIVNDTTNFVSQLFQTNSSKKP